MGVEAAGLLNGLTRTWGLLKRETPSLATYMVECGGREREELVAKIGSRITQQIALERGDVT